MLDRLYRYHQPLAEHTREHPAARVLCSPLTPVLALNAAYFPARPAEVDFAGAPHLFLNEQGVPGAKAVQQVEVGRVQGLFEPSGHTVEQVNWLQAARFAAVLCRAWGLPEWQEPVAQHFSRVLQQHPQYTPLLCYQDHQLSGCGLLLGQQLHLWGVLDAAALQDLLSYSVAHAGGPIETTLPAGFDLPLLDPVSLVYSLEAHPGA